MVADSLLGSRRSVGWGLCHGKRLRCERDLYARGRAFRRFYLGKSASLEIMPL